MYRLAQVLNIADAFARVQDVREDGSLSCWLQLQDWPVGPPTWPLHLRRPTGRPPRLF
jgi:hypothetical protein